jgi:gliding motility-associated-like protein
MKKLLLLFLVLTGFSIHSQTSCQNAQPFCTGGISGVTFPATVNGPPAQVGPDYDCLFTQPNPAWYYLQIGQSGNLIFTIAGQIGNGPGQDVDFCCWGPFNSLSGICNSLTANYVVDCSYSPSYTETCTIPNGVAGQYYMVLITNYANVQQNIVFNQIGGTGSTNCALLANNAVICAGNNATIIANNPNLTGPSYSMNPGAITSPNATFVVSPSVTTQYTLYCTGTNNLNNVVTVTTVANVTVNPNPQIAPTFTQTSCTNTLNSVNLNLTFNPPGAPSYTVLWSPTPASISPNQTTAYGLGAGTNTVAVIAAGGCSTIATFTMSGAAGPATFNIIPPGATFSVTCLNPVVSLTANPVGLNYTWISLSYSVSGNTATFSGTNQGVYTVTAINPNGGCTSQQTIAIGVNTVAPTNSVNPTLQVINCSTNSAVTFSGTALSPTVNIQHDWYSPLNPLPGGVPISTSNNTLSILSGNIPPGVYTLVTTNLVNGCTAMKTVTITALSAFPTFSIASPTNFSIGCAPLNQTTINIINPISTQTPPATCSYTFLPPTFTGAVTPSVILGGNTSTVTTIPGTWTVIVEDNSNFCRTILSVPIIQNTVAPDVSASMYTQTLTCNTPTVLATGSSTTANTNVTWLMPVTPPSLGSPTLVIGAPPTGPNTSTTSLSYASFTVVATNSINACQTTSVVVINQNFKPPVSTPTISIGTATAIYCTVNSNPVVLTTGASTVTSGVPFAFASPYLWEGPSPQASVSGASSYSAYVAGVYTLTIKDSYNGCLRTGTIQVLDRTQPPVISSPLMQSTLDCGSNQATMIFSLTGVTTGGVRYLVKSYPLGAAFNPTNAPIYDLNPLLSGTSSSSVQVSKPGSYIYIVSNTLTGCQAFGTVQVLPGDITAEFSPNPATGYAPLAVDFNNTSHTSLGTGSITSIWNFGNGTSQSYTTTANATAEFTAAGTYTVMLLAQRGNCIDTAYQVVKVDMPSKLEVPNVFTPNGDGANDVFFLKVANITELYAVIVDRWGNKVYEVTSNSGNIAWDGKNLQGKECAVGTYFYIIKGTGKDDKNYEMKGNVSLYR